MYGAHRPNISRFEAMDALISQATRVWNIREQNVIHGAIVDSESHVISLENIAPERQRPAIGSSKFKQSQ
jgi:hypothetical protein